MSSMYYGGSASERYNSQLEANKFPSPFFDMASTAMPLDNTALMWCEFIFGSNSVYRQAAVRCVSYFLTDIDVRSPAAGAEVGRDDADKWLSFYADRDLVGHEFLMGLDILCFHGDTKAVTRDGIFSLRELAGKRVDVLSRGGVYRPADFKSFGRQKLWKVTFSDGSYILATPEHRWIVYTQGLPGEVREELELSTCLLEAGHLIPRVVAGEESPASFAVVSAVEDTGETDEVFCCVEMETHTFAVGDSLLTRQCYGNHFCSVIKPFKRMLRCPHKGCGLTAALREMDERKSTFRYRFANMQFMATCPKCKKSGAWEISDMPDDRPEKITIKRWSPHDMVIKSNLITDEKRFFWRIPEEYKRDIRKGSILELETCPAELLDAIRKNQTLFEFGPDQIFHGLEPTLSGLVNRGWGISRTLVNFRQVWYVQLLHRYNEAIAADFVIPFRVLTPRGSSRGGVAGEPISSINGPDFTRAVSSMVKKRRFNPTDWYTLPYPLEYQILGGEARQMAPTDLLEQGYDWMLEGLGAPVELRKGTLSTQAMPISLRVFEASFRFLININNRFLRWYTDRVTRNLSWEKVLPVHQRVTHADDMQKTMAILQMAAGGNVSLTTALRMLGLDNRQEQRLLTDDAKYTQELQARAQEVMAQNQFGEQLSKGTPLAEAQGGGAAAAPGAPGAAPAGGAPAPGVAPGMGGAGPITAYLQQSGNTAMDPQAMWDIANQLAQSLLQYPPSVRNSELEVAKEQSPLLYSAIKQLMTQVRSDAASQGREQIMQQQYGTV